MVYQPMKMILRLGTSVALIVLSVLPVKATTLNGLIRANEVGGQPLANVRVVAEGANPTTSEDFGRFSLEFPHKGPGEPVEVIVQQDGYVAVNDVQLQLTLPAKAEDKVLTIILCKEADREEIARRFYRLKSNEAIEATYQQKLKVLEEEHRADAAALSKLQQERDQAKATAEKAAEELAKNQPGQSSELYRQAKRLFLDGKIDEAIQLLNDEKLRRSVTQANKAIEDAVQSWLLKAQLLALKFRFEEAEKAYLQAIEAKPDSAEANFDYGLFNQKLNRFEKARAAYGRCLEWVRKNGKEDELALTLNALGSLDHDQNRKDEAQAEYQEALQIRRKLAKSNPEAYLPDVADTLNDLANLDSAQHRRDQARSEYQEALQIRRKLAQSSPEVYLPDVAGTLNNLANLDSDQNRHDQARSEYQEALETYRGLAQTNPEAYLADVAMTLRNLADLDRDQHRHDQARSEYQEALKTYRGLAQSNPEAYLPDVAQTLRDLAVLDRAQNRSDEAQAEYQEALKTYRGLAQKDPEAYLPALAMTLNNLANLDRDQNRPDQARSEYQEALQIYEAFAKQSPERFSPDVARVKRLLGQLR